MTEQPDQPGAAPDAGRQPSQPPPSAPSSQQPYPQAPYPQAPYAQQPYPQAPYAPQPYPPQQPLSGPPAEQYPHPGAPQPGYPQPGHPQPGYPQPGHPQQGLPHPAYPQQAYPQQGYPQQGYPQHPPYGFAPQPPFPVPGQYPIAMPPGGSEPLSPGAKRIGWVLVVLGVLTFVFAFLPWATIGPISANGVGSGGNGAKDGNFTLVLGLLCAAGGLVRALGRRRGGLQLAMPIVTLCLAAIITLTALADIGSVSDENPGTEGLFTVSVGSGLWLTLVAGLALIATSIVGIVKRR